jgi:hypothetical protein
MNELYKTEGEIIALVGSFEDASVARGVWKHAEHLVVALYYVTNYDLETATTRMRDGLFDLLTEGFKVDLTKEMPYHETLTVFWMRTVDDFARENPSLSLTEKANILIERYDKDYPLRFYNRELLFSDRARAEFVEPDIWMLDISAGK